ncbi:hypothetical protein [Sphingomicrobium sediminis]|uniref:Uncharacterized protein n=1 Tax=Sphingomicrobium sediminis TaxID=2950949 RepID=A0A9X2EFS9_9SPHN|nr:hypothetical protein [Sphingomicrobium sediminis]MCM8556730.1 hypothetical protein [Sphingomicrobium sediminis]
MAKDKKSRFVIKVGETYYLTTGKMLIYNMDEAIAADDMKKVKGVEDMRKAYQEEHDKPHTYYHAVDFSEVEFKGINTDQVP